MSTEKVKLELTRAELDTLVELFRMVRQADVPGWRSPALMRVRRRVYAARFLEGPKAANHPFQPFLQQALEEEQARAGEDPEAVLGPGVVRVPVQRDRVGQDYLSQVVPIDARLMGLDMEADRVTAIILQPYPPDTTPENQRAGVEQYAAGHHIWPVDVTPEHVVLIVSGVSPCDCLRCASRM